jgi:hypothetical protein
MGPINNKKYAASSWNKMKNVLENNDSGDLEEGEQWQDSPPGDRRYEACNRIDNKWNLSTFRATES